MDEFYKRIKLIHKLRFYELFFESLLLIGSIVLTIGFMYNM